MDKQNFISRVSCVLAALIIATGVMFAQTQTVKHVVERGETLEDIAKRYNVSKDEIISLNPSAAQFVFVGMELNIPQKGAGLQTGNGTQLRQSEGQSNLGQTAPSSNGMSHDDGSTGEDDDSKWGSSAEIGYGFIKGADNYTYEATIGVNYNITQNAYVSARIGYNSANYNDYTSERGSYLSYTTTVHILRIPLEAGFKFLNNDRTIGIVPFASLGINIGLSGKNKYKSNTIGENETKLKVGGKVGVDGVLGARIYLYQFTISGGYHFPFNDRQKVWFGKDAYPMVSIGWIM